MLYVVTVRRLLERFSRHEEILEEKGTIREIIIFFILSQEQKNEN
jgi:hypothetical protein